jgi:N-dimethylarginine dimethylaminohydrolase
MCPPAHFAVRYSINPWMDPSSWALNDRALTSAAGREWSTLYRTLSGLGASVELVPPAAGLPDLVFTANAAVVLDGTALLARFRHAERRREEPHFARALRALQELGAIARVVEIPEGLVLEGAGDCVFDRTRNLFWLGYGPRSDAAASRVVEETFGVGVAALELADPRFYHMDTALSALPNGEVMYLPEAFTPKGRAAIRDRVSPTDRIKIGIEDAVQLAANAVCLEDHVVLAGCSDRVRGQLNERGYRVIVTPLHSFLRSGGAAFCLTLRLDRLSAARPASIGHTAAA